MPVRGAPEPEIVISRALVDARSTCTVIAKSISGKERGNESNKSDEQPGEDMTELGVSIAGALIASTAKTSA